MVRAAKHKQTLQWENLKGKRIGVYVLMDILYRKIFSQSAGSAKQLEHHEKRLDIVLTPSRPADVFSSNV